MKPELLNLTKDLWSRYTVLNPQAETIRGLFAEENKEVVNDHIAFRTFNCGPFSNTAMVSFFESYGYKVCDSYHFDVKKLDAVHMECADPDAPKIFLSELKVEEFSPYLQEVVKKAIDEVATCNFSEIFNCPRVWTAEHTVYEKLNEESAYAAWLYAHGIQVNHFTVFVNGLSQYTELVDLTNMLTAKGFPMNVSGGMIKGAPEQWLEQASTMAPSVPVGFADGTFEIPGCYYEFAKRYEKPNGELFQGFVTTSADKIFESTNTSQ